MGKTIKGGIVKVIRHVSIGCSICKEDMSIKTVVLDEKYQTFLVADCETCDTRIAVSLEKLLDALAPENAVQPSKKVN